MNLESDLKSERIDIRTTPYVKRLLQEAAATANKTVDEFLVDSALTEAAEVLANRSVFFLDDKQWQEFMAAPDAPPSPMPRMEKLMREPSLLERQLRANEKLVGWGERSGTPTSAVDPRRSGDSQHGYSDKEA